MTSLQVGDFVHIVGSCRLWSVFYGTVVRVRYISGISIYYVRVCDNGYHPDVNEYSSRELRKINQTN